MSAYVQGNIVLQVSKAELAKTEKYYVRRSWMYETKKDNDKMSDDCFGIDGIC